MMQQLRSGTKKRYLESGIFSVERSPKGALSKRIVGNPKSHPFDVDEYLFRNIQPGALEFFVQREIYLPLHAVAPLQYAAFDLVGEPATLFNFNLDGLASRFCSRRHRVLEPHGRVDTKWFEPSHYEYWRDAVTENDFQLPHLVWKLLPSYEPRHIVQMAAYREAEMLFSRSLAVLIIGYSFSMFNGKLDDWASWNFILGLLKSYPLPVFILSPFPEELADTLRQALSRKNIFGVPVFWEIFAATLFATVGAAGKIGSQWPDRQLRDFIYRYDFNVDHR